MVQKPVSKLKGSDGEVHSEEIEGWPESQDIMTARDLFKLAAEGALQLNLVVQ
jgi:hypothetical protein